MNKRSSAILILIACLTCSCSQLYPQFSPTDTAAVTVMPSLEPTKVLDTTNCFYVEASSDMPTAADQVTSALKSDKINVVNTAARGDGKNYICPEAGTSTFSSNQTTLTITIKVDSLDDLNTLGMIAGKVVDNLMSLSQQAVPHWQDGQIQINFTSGSDSRNLVFPAAYAITSRGKGLDGASLWQALNNQPCTNQTSQDSETDLSSQIQEAINHAGVSGISASVTVDGIQCVNPQDGTVESYSAQQTTFNFNLSVSSMTDTEAIGNDAAQALAALSGVSKTTIPGNQPAEIFFTVDNGSNQQTYSIGYAQAMNAFQSGYKGTKLFSLLSIKS
ncbi:MAG: hypothetical protein P4L50_01465 [Anaerolineaceae bacterium]|nr:hypothetical protein [Anaerolineaceae bacterium]